MICTEQSFAPLCVPTDMTELWHDLYAFKASAQIFCAMHSQSKKLYLAVCSESEYRRTECVRCGVHTIIRYIGVSRLSITAATPSAR